MSKLLGLLIILGLLYVGRLLFKEYEAVKAKDSRQEQAAYDQPPVSAPAPVANGGGSGLPGLPSSLEAQLTAARSQGASGLKNFLQTYRHAIRDPRLAEIELDYVVQASRQDPGDARRVFKTVQQRTQPGSPLYSRVKGMERSYE